jgi:hypothetical protein
LVIRTVPFSTSDSVQQKLGGRHVPVDALVVLGADGSDDGVLVVVLVLRPDADLRDPAVLSVDRVAQDADLGAQHRLLEGEALAEAELGAGRAGVELLAGRRQLDAVVPADGAAEGAQLVILYVDIGPVDLAADAVIGLVAGDHRPGRQAAARAAFQRADAVGEQQLAAGLDLARRGGRRQAAGQRGRGQHSKSLHSPLQTGDGSRLGARNLATKLLRRVSK